MARLGYRWSSVNEPPPWPTKPYKFIRFGAMNVTKPYEFIGFGAMDVTKAYEFIGFGAPPDRLQAKPARQARPHDPRNNFATRSGSGRAGT